MGVVRDEDTGTTSVVSFTVVVSRVAASDIDGDVCLIWLWKMKNRVGVVGEGGGERNDTYL